MAGQAGRDADPRSVSTGNTGFPSRRPALLRVSSFARSRDEAGRIGCRAGLPKRGGVAAALRVSCPSRTTGHLHKARRIKKLHARPPGLRAHAPRSLPYGLDIARDTKPETFHRSPAETRSISPLLSCNQATRLSQLGARGQPPEIHFSDPRVLSVP